MFEGGGWGQRGRLGVRRGQGQRSGPEGAPAQDGRLQGRSWEVCPPVQFARQRRVRPRQAGSTGSVQLREQGDHGDHGPQPPGGTGGRGGSR